MSAQHKFARPRFERASAPTVKNSHRKCLRRRKRERSRRAARPRGLSATDRAGRHAILCYYGRVPASISTSARPSTMYSPQKRDPVCSKGDLISAAAAAASRSAASASASEFKRPSALLTSHLALVISTDTHNASGDQSSGAPTSLQRRPRWRGRRRCTFSWIVDSSTRFSRR